jgi:D-glycero-D-manno-heptose 1,7-bisphosphate phosphatase
LPVKAVFLDRDGVINDLVPEDGTGTPESPYRPEDVRLMPEAADAIKRLRDAGFLLVAASNQPAAAKGNATQEQLSAVHERIVELLAAEGAALDDWRYCFHHPDFTGPCDCRKPEPGMLLDAAKEHGIDLSQSWMVGDADRDIEAGRRAGVRTVLVEHPGSAHRRKGAPSHAVVRNLSAAVGIILLGSDR